MEWLDRTVRTLVLTLSRMLDPVMVMIARVDYEIRHTADMLGVPFDWQRIIVGAFWVLIVVMLIRTTARWLRLIILILVALILAKTYGTLPGT